MVGLRDWISWRGKVIYIFHSFRWKVWKQILLEFHTSIYYFNFSFKDMRLLRESLIERLGMNKPIILASYHIIHQWLLNWERIDEKERCEENKSCLFLTERRSWDDGIVSFSSSNSYSSSCLGSSIKKYKKVKIKKKKIKKERESIPTSRLGAASISSVKPFSFFKLLLYYF